MAAKKGIVSPMEASLSKPVDDSAPSGWNTNHHGHIYNMPTRGVLKHLTEPAWPMSLNAEGWPGTPETGGKVAGRSYQEGYADKDVTTKDELEHDNRPSPPKGRRKK